MDIYSLLQFIEGVVPTFQDIELIDQEGVAYHYTPHWNKIQESGRFLGADIGSNLDCTQSSIISAPALYDPGVVFAYEQVAEAREEGFDLDIIKITYRKALKAFHTQENYLDSMTDIEIGLLYPSSEFKERDKLATILMLNTDIVAFEKI